MDNCKVSLCEQRNDQNAASIEKLNILWLLGKTIDLLGHRKKGAGEQKNKYFLYCYHLVLIV